MSSWASLALCTVICFAAAAIGGWATAGSVGTWYQTLAKPAWNPPDRVFGPVWSVLYLTMAVALWLVVRSGSWPECRTAVALFGLQLLLNMGWSALFFGLRRPDLAAVEIGVLWVTIAATVLAFWRHSPVAAALLLPYLAWVSFASLLNFTIWQMNRGLSR